MGAEIMQIISSDKPEGASSRYKYKSRLDDPDLAYGLDEIRSTLMTRVEELNERMADLEAELKEKDKIIRTQARQINSLEKARQREIEKEKKRREKEKNQQQQNLDPLAFKIDAPVSDDYEEIITSLMTESEKELYYKRKQEYLQEFELNSSSDYILLQDVLFQEIIKLRLMKIKLENPLAANVDDSILACTDRIQRNLEALGMLRKQRLTQKEQIETSIADLIAQFDKEKYYSIQQALLAEEQEEFEKKKERDAKITGYEMAMVEFEKFLKYQQGVDNINGNSKATT